MKLLTFEHGGGAALGALCDDGEIAPLSALSNNPALGSMQALIEGGAAALDEAHGLTKSPGQRLRPDEIVWLSPLPQPVQMRDFLVFEEHMRMAGWRGSQLRARWGAPPAPAEPPPVPPIWYEQPIYYKCNRFAVAGPMTTVEWPKRSSLIDYELELACVIGRGGRDIAAEDAEAHIFGYTIFNDLTARDLQFKEMQAPLGPAKGKDFDGANILGPVIVTADAMPDLSQTGMRAFVNGELWSEGVAGSMYWPFSKVIEYVSTSETLHPGEVLGSGTVGGGCGLELGRFLKHDDVVALEVDGIGRIETRIHAPHVTERVTL